MFIFKQLPLHMSSYNQLHPFSEHTPPFVVLIIIVAIIVLDTHKIIIFDEQYTFTLENRRNKSHFLDYTS